MTSLATAYPTLDTRTVPWAGAGVALPTNEFMDDDEVIAKGGLDWTVSLQPVKYGDDNRIYPGKFVVSRDTDHRPFGTVGSKFRTFQNRQLVEFGSVFADTTAAKWDTVLTARHGAHVVLAFRLDQTDLVLPNGDEMSSWMLLSNFHGGDGSLSIGIVKIRLWCTNTVNWALKNARSTYKIRHTGDLNAKIAQARQALDVSFRYDEEFQKDVAKLLDKEITDKRFANMVDKVLVPASAREIATNELRPSTVERRQSLLAHAASTPTVDDSSSMSCLADSAAGT